jgi:predicted dehydrogenase
VVRIGVIGCGYWGPNVTRNFAALDGVEVVALCDSDALRLESLRRRYRNARPYRDAHELLSDPRIDAVAICTPVHTHHPLGRAALEAGKHLLIEKPLAASVDQALALVELAENRGLVLEVDHTFVYSPAVRKLASIIESGELGELLYIDSVRINLGLFHSDVNVMWDLAPHDVSIIHALVRRAPLWVSAVARAHCGPQECQAYLTIQFEDSVLAHVHVNWLAPVKIRSTLIGGSRRMVVYDDLAPSEKVRIYEKGVHLNGGASRRTSALVDYRDGDMRAPYIDKTEPLANVCRDFVEAIEGGRAPVVDGRAGLAVVRVLEAAQESIARNGERVALEGAGSSTQWTASLH